MQTIYTIHAPDTEKLEQVIAEMRELGAPTIRVVDCGDFFMALEGSHRVPAAAELGITPTLVVLEQDDLVDADSLDWQDYLQEGQQYTAGELAGEVRGHGNCAYSFDNR
ncbi:MAG: hypothetical protein ITG07_02365 [Candidimonas sp.]|nr:hypothetical protein [Candidimonas sp.]